jgi:subtilisin family serine protease
MRDHWNLKNLRMPKVIILIFTLCLFNFSAIAKSSKTRVNKRPLSLKGFAQKKKFFKEGKLQPSAKSRHLLKVNKPAFNLGLLDSTYASWGISSRNKKSSINLLEAWKLYKKKKEIVVAVVDTGIDPQHPFLKNNLYVPKGPAQSSHYGMDFSKGRRYKYTPFDGHGHGTHVSGIIKSIFPDVKILTLKYYNPKASGQENLNSTVKALEYAVNQNVDIINYSGGGPEPSITELRILKRAEEKGILIIAAAGNESSNIDDKKKAYYPASYGLDNIISVTAYNQSLNILSSSNYGKSSVDIFAPGYRIKSSYPYNRAVFLTGTSQATAFVTGVVSLIKSMNPKLSSKQIKTIINNSAKREKTMINKSISGGRLDAGSALRMAISMTQQKRSISEVSQKKLGQGKIILRRASSNKAVGRN